MTDGRYSKVSVETQPTSTPPAEKEPREPTVVVRGNNWPMTVLIALFVAAAGVAAGRRTAPAPDADTIEMHAEISDIHRDVAAIRESLMQRDNAVNNRLVVIEARLAAMHEQRP